MKSFDFNELKSKINQTMVDIFERNQRLAEVNRLKIVMKNEADSINQKYIELGKMYYKTMRNSENFPAEKLCKEIAVSVEKIGELTEKIKDLKKKPEIPEEQIEIEFYDDSSEDIEKVSFGSCENNPPESIKKETTANEVIEAVKELSEEQPASTKIKLVVENDEKENKE